MRSLTFDGIELLQTRLFRVHYHIKKALAKEKRLEFLWQQPWGRVMRSSTLDCHTGHRSYGFHATVHSSHAVPGVHDFLDMRSRSESLLSVRFRTRTGWPHVLPVGSRSCADYGRERPRTVSGMFTIDDRSSDLCCSSRLILDQYRKKAQLYRTNVLFVQLGDDFRYRSAHEVRVEFDNYDKIFAYINQRTDWNTQVRREVFRTGGKSRCLPDERVDSVWHFERLFRARRASETVARVSELRRRFLHLR